MTVHAGGAAALEYYLCQYGNSRVQFRGPKRALDDGYVAFLGSTETYGRFIRQPFPELLEGRLGIECPNFGAVNGGVDLYLNDPSVLDLASGARAKVVQIMGAQNMSNRYYQVHPRRNDRFLRASRRLEALYPEIDFIEFHFNRHMLGRLQEVSAERFAEVEAELQTAWVARMKHLLTILRGHVVLLWFSDGPIPEGTAPARGNVPMFITREMVNILRPRVSALHEVVPSDKARVQGTRGMVFSEFEACAAAELVGPLAHVEAANRLEADLQDLLGI